MGKREAANDPDPEGWGDFVRHRRNLTEPRDALLIPPYVPEERPTDRLEDIPPDVHYDDDTLTCWNGKAFVSWQKWRLSVPFHPIVDPKYGPRDYSKSLTAICNDSTRVFCLGTANRWTIRIKPRNQTFWIPRPDFETASQEECRESAENWYGVPRKPWRPFVLKNPPKGGF